MTTNVKQIAAGADRAEFHLLDTNGYANGNGSVTAGAAGQGAIRILGIQTADPAIQEGDVVDIPGDDGSQGVFEFDPTSTPSFIMTYAVQDLDQDGLWQGTNVESQGDMRFGVLQPKDRADVDAMINIVSKAKSKESGAEGQSKYHGYLLPRCTVRPLGRVAFEGRTGGAFRARVTVQSTDTMPWGKTLNNTDNGTESAPVIPWTATNRITVQRFTQSTGVTAFGPLAQTPAGATVAKIRVFVNKTIQLAGWTADVTTRVITFTPAPADGAVIVVVYEYTL